MTVRVGGQGHMLAGMPMHAALSALAPDANIIAGTPGGTLTLGVTARSEVCADASLAQRPGAVVLLRFALERAWMRRVPGLPAAAATLLAARAAGCFLHMLPAAERDAALQDPAIPLFARLAGDPLPIAQLTACWRLLAEANADGEIPPDVAALRTVERLWPFAAATETLLVEGGDDRLTPDPATAQNRYLCTPWPQPDVISFSSCTASSISQGALAAAEQTRQALFEAALSAPADAVIAEASASITADLLHHFDIADSAEAVLAASGTDATLLLTGLLAAERPRETITTILMSPAETGSGVPEAVQGRHFASCTAAGITVEKGGAVDGFPPGLSLVSVALRTPDGLPRPADSIAAECEGAIEEAAKRGHVVLHAIDGSKTGMAAPGLLALDLLAERFRGRLDIVIDACQLRVEPQIIRTYLERGWPVLVTGSKFFGAPGFCGAILFPRHRLRRIAGAGRLPGGLGAYASVADGSVSRRCPGLLLRWSAALNEMRAFARIPARDIAQSIDTAGAHARAAMMRHAFIQLMPAPRPHRGDWSHRPSVLTFAVRRAGVLLSAAALRPFYLALAADSLGPRCVIGQPVQLGTPEIGGLRIAFSAAQIGSAEDVRPGLAAVFGKLAELVK
jgi:hypothetical protein